MTVLSRTAIRWESFRTWWNQPHRASERWLGKHCAVVAWLGLLLALISAPHGSGMSLCWFQSSTGLPCPGCGMTRSLSCGMRGMFSESWHYHPFGLLVLALFVFVATQSLCPGTFRERIARFMQKQATLFNSCYVAFVVTFVSFGTIRAVVHLGELWQK